MEQTIWIFTSKEGSVLRGKRFLQFLLWGSLGGGGQEPQRLYVTLEKLHIAMAGMTLRDHVERSLARGRYQSTLY